MATLKNQWQNCKELPSSIKNHDNTRGEDPHNKEWQNHGNKEL